MILRSTKPRPHALAFFDTPHPRDASLRTRHTDAHYTEAPANRLFLMMA